MMTRKMLIGSVALIALATPASVSAQGELPVPQERGEQAKKGDKGNETRQQRRAQKRQEQRKERRAERRQAQRAEQRQERRAEARAEQRQERRAQARAEKRQQERRAERRQARAKAQQAERRQERRAEQRQERRAEQRAEQRRQERLAERRTERRLEQRQERRAEARAEQRRKEVRRDLRQRQKAFRQAQKRAERQAARRTAYRDWVADRNRADRLARMRDDVRFVTVGSRIQPDWYSSRLPSRYRDRYADDRDYYYRYDDDLDHLYRIDRRYDRVQSVIPLSYSYGMIGQRIPTYYQSAYAPRGYQGYYYDQPDRYYRQVGPAVYGMNPETQLLTAVVALLTGANFQVGQMMPSGYDVYNVPMAYRDRYYDRDDAWYRYDDGSVYRIDPYSRRVTGSYPLYDARYRVGNAWPTDYPGYNVPAGYRGLYYDSPENDYRYAQGRIYQVDPKTQMIMALASLVTGQPFAVGQPMPSGYDVYNVPLDHRARFVDRDDRWYRYNDGYVYAVDPANRMVVDSYSIYS